MTQALKTVAVERVVKGLAGGVPGRVPRSEALAVLQPSWTNSSFLAPAWVARSAPPGEKYPRRIEFNRIAPEWQLFARLFLVLAEYPVKGTRGERPVRSGSRFLRMFGELVWLTKFMERQELTTFCEWSPQDVVKAMREWASTPVRSDCKTRGHTSFLHMQSTMQRLFLLGPSRLVLMPDGLAVDPTRIASPAVLGFLVEGGRSTREIPEATAHRLWQTAMSWLESVSPLVIDALAVEEAARDPANRSMQKQALSARGRAQFQQRNLRRLVAHVAAAVPFRLSLLLHERKGMRTKPVDNETLLCCRPLKAVEVIWNMTVAAAYIVMAMLSGFRVSELLSVSCTGVRRRGEGWRALSTIRKTSSRELGFETERPVPRGFVQAHTVLRTLARARGREAGGAAVFVTARGIVPGGARINVLINQFASAHGIEWQLKTHQFRKFFALFYVRRFKGPIDALRWHFRHLSREMIEAYIKDALNARYMAEAEAEVAEEVLSSVIHADGEYAMPPPVSRYAGIRERYRARNLPLEEVERVLRMVETAQNARVVAMEWGYCVDAKGCSGVAACRDGSGWPRRDLAVPKECFMCPLLAIGRENEARVRQSLAVHQDVLDSPLATPLAKRHSAVIVERMEAALKDLRPNENAGRRWTAGESGDA